MNNKPSPRAPAIPISASRASPGPFTAQPRTATFNGTLSLEMYSSTSLAIEMSQFQYDHMLGKK